AQKSTPQNSEITSSHRGQGFSFARARSRQLKNVEQNATRNIESAPFAEEMAALRNHWLRTRIHRAHAASICDGGLRTIGASNESRTVICSAKSCMCTGILPGRRV